MKYLKIFTSIILTIVLTFGVVVMDPIEVMATLPNVPGSGTTFVPLPLISLYETLRDGINDGGSPLDFIKEAIKNSGFLSPEIPALEDLTSLNQYIGRKAPELQGETPEETAENVGNYLINNVSVSDNSITFNDNSKNFTQGIINDYVASNTAYCYSFHVDRIAQYFSTATPYTALLSLMTPELDNKGIWMYQYVNSKSFVYYLDLSDDPYLVFKSRQSNDNPVGDLLNAKPYGSDGFLQSVDVIYVWNTSNSSWDVHTNSNLALSTQNYMSKVLNGEPSGSNYCYWFNRTPKRFRWFSNSTTINAHNILYQPYYYNNDVYTDFSSSVGDYTFTPTNINTVSYGDTTTYIDSFNREEGYPPSIPEINNYINQQNEQNINTGNGSGGNGSGGNGSGDGNSNIFDWLKDLGSVLGNLIKGLGEFLTEIVSGLVSAITSLLESLSGLVTGVLESLTNIFSGLITFLYDGLPSEVKSVLTLGLTVALLITVIKLIRGN